MSSKRCPRPIVAEMAAPFPEEREMLEKELEVTDAEPTSSRTISGDEMVMGLVTESGGDKVTDSRARVPAHARMIAEVVEVEKASWNVNILKSTIGLEVPVVVMVKTGAGTSAEVTVSIGLMGTVSASGA